jgi:hypothetical protein
MIRKFRISKILAAAAVAATVAFSAVAAHASPVNLGDAANYAVLAIDSMSFNGPGTINGNVAVGQSVNFASPAVINGKLFEAPGVTGPNNITVTGGTTTNFSLTSAINAAQAAATTANALSATQTFGTLGNNSTINGNGGMNVIDVSGITLTNGVLTLHGSASDTFVINDSGGFTFSNSTMALSGGLTSANVLINVTKDVAITGGGTNPTFYGTILAPNSDISVHDDTLNGALIGKTIEDTSGFKVNGPTAVPLPAPAVSGAVLFGVMALGAFLKKKAALSLT